MVSEIFELKEVRDQISGLSKREAELSKPKLIDLSLIPYIYHCFTESFGMGETRKNGAIQRKKFIFIVMLLYSPSLLAGGRINSGLRKHLTRILKINSPTVISHTCENLLFSYQHYQGFRSDIDNAYSCIECKLREEGHIK